MGSRKGHDFLLTLVVAVAFGTIIGVFVTINVYSQTVPDPGHPGIQICDGNLCVTEQGVVIGRALIIGKTPQAGVWNSMVPSGNTVTSPAVTGYGDVDITVGKNGLPVEAHIDYTSGTRAMNLVLCETQDCSSSTVMQYSGSFQGTDEVSVAIGSDKAPIVVFTESSTLKVLKCANPGCTSWDAAAQEFETGSNPNIVIQNDRYPAVVYKDTSDNIKFLKCGHLRCELSSATTTTLSNIGSTGKIHSVAVGSDGFVSFPFYDGTDGYLKFLKCPDLTCTGPTTKQLESNYGAGARHSVVFVDGLPLIFYSSGTSLLSVACNNNDCNSKNPSKTIDTLLSGTFTMSSTVGARGNPIVAYLPTSPPAVEMRVVECGKHDCSGGNSLQSISDTNMVGPEIAISGDGLPVIAYRENLQQIKILKCGSQNCIPYWTRR